MPFALPTSAQSKRFKRSHKAGGAYPMNSRRQAASARGRAVMSLNRGRLTLTEARTIFRKTEALGLAPSKLVKVGDRFHSEPTKRRRNPKRKKNTMAARKRRTPARKRRTVRRARNPRRRAPRRSTRAGQRRVTARRAYRPRRRNPRAGKVLGTPAFRFGLSAIGGAVVGQYVDSNSGEGQMFSALRPDFLPAQLGPSFVAAMLTYASAAFLVKKARTRQTLVALGTGMLFPTVAGFASGAMAKVDTAILTGAGGETLLVQDNGNGTTTTTTVNPIRRRSARRMPAYSSANAFVADLIPG